MPDTTKKSDKNPGRIVWIILAGLLAVAVLFAVNRLLYQQLLNGLRNTGQSTLELVTSSLRGEIQRFEILSSVLATDNELLRFLIDQNDIPRPQINRKLEEINRSTGALDTYLMDEKGTTLAASNWKTPVSFVGRNFSYRPYFQSAIHGQSANFFAIGTSSNLRGFYIATPVSLNYKPVGVVVIKVRVEHLERLWQAENRELSLIDENSVIFVSTNPDWRLRSLRALSESEINSIKNTRQYPDPHAIDILNYEKSGQLSSSAEIALITVAPENKPKEYLQLSSRMEEAHWTVLLSSETKEVKRVAFYGTLAIGFGLVGLGIIAYAIYLRLQSARRKLEREQRYRNKLESAIAERTRDLQKTNQELIETQQKLIQSGKLAAIGRFSAGLSHEISQPLTAIHSYISNAQQLITLERYEEADKKLDHIGNLADRIALIIRQLKIFVRGDELPTAPVSLISAIEEAKTIMADQIGKSGASVTTRFQNGEAHIDGDEILLQQLFVNLISNALDATSESERPRIDILVKKNQEQACIEVSDNGLGVSEKDLPSIFDPFYSTKEMGRGLGLGLTIAQEIVSRFHGEMSARNNDSGGAVFTVTAPLYMRNG